MTQQRRTEEPSNAPEREQRPQRVDWLAWLWYIPMLFLLFWFWEGSLSNANLRTLPYSEFKALVADGQIIDCRIDKDEIIGIMKASDDTESSHNKTKLDRTDPATSDEPTPTEPQKPTTSYETDEATQRFRTIRVDDPNLVEELEAAGITFVGVQPTYIMQFLMAFLMPIGLLILLWIFLSRRMSTFGQGIMSVGKSHAKLVADRDVAVNFQDVAGCDEAKYELQEVIDFLQHPDKYKRLGARWTALSPMSE